MSESIAELTASPAEIEVNNKKLKLYPLKWKNFGALDRWLKDEIVMRGKRAVADTMLTAAQRESIMSAAFKEASSFSAVDDVLLGSRSRIMATIEGMLRAICESVANGEPNEKLRLTIDDLDAYFGSSAALITGAYIRLIQISLPEYFQKKEGQSTNPPQTVSQ